MSWVSKALNSSIGLKVLMALTGLLLVGFAVGHLAGNLLVFVGPEALNAYAKGLHDLGPLLWVARIVLLVAVFIHIYAGIKLSAMNKLARPQPYQKKSYTKASLASRSMILSGLVVCAFVIYHLAHFTFLWTHPEYAQLGEYAVYERVVAGFQVPVIALFYLVSVALLGLHLSHGVSSLFQTIGWNHPKYNGLLRGAGPVLGGLLAVGFGSIPLAVMLGFVGS